MDKNVNVYNFQCHDFSLINERCPTLEFIRPFDASILHPRNFATYDFTLDILLLIYRMQFSNVDGIVSSVTGFLEVNQVRPQIEPVEATFTKNDLLS